MVGSSSRLNDLPTFDVPLKVGVVEDPRRRPAITSSADCFFPESLYFFVVETSESDAETLFKPALCDEFFEKLLDSILHLALSSAKAARALHPSVRSDSLADSTVLLEEDVTEEPVEVDIPRGALELAVFVGRLDVLEELSLDFVPSVETEVDVEEPDPRPAVLVDVPIPGLKRP